METTGSGDTLDAVTPTLLSKGPSDPQTPRPLVRPSPTRLARGVRVSRSPLVPPSPSSTPLEGRVRSTHPILCPRGIEQDASSDTRR